MDAVDRAIIQAFKSQWKPPAGSELDPDNSSVLMDITVGRSGLIEKFKLVQPSGHAMLDQSVLKTGNALSNIGMRLPPGYPADRYEPRLNFHAE